MYSDAMCRLAARVIIVELGARVIFDPKRNFVTAHTGLFQKKKCERLLFCRNACMKIGSFRYLQPRAFFCRHSCRTGAAAVRFFMKSVPGGIRFGSVPYLPVSIVSYII